MEDCFFVCGWLVGLLAVSNADWLSKLQVAEGEARVSLLQREVERLSQALLRAQEGESALKEKTASLSQTLQEAAAAHSGTQSRLVALQKTLSLVEQDKKLLQVSPRKTKAVCVTEVNG